MPDPEYYDSLELNGVEKEIHDTGARNQLADLPNKMDKANPTGTGAFSLNRAAGTTVGDYSSATGNACEASGQGSHAEGITTVASNYTAHAEGKDSIASGPYSHSEGVQGEASGDGSHNEGNGCVASGHYSHAEGAVTVASGSTAHAEGTGTVAAGLAQHAGGVWNKIDNNDTYAEIIGNGQGENDRSDARTLDWNGNERLAGGLTINAGTASETDIGTALSGKADASALATVATSGAYSDLTGQPTIPTDTNREIKADGTTLLADDNHNILNICAGTGISLMSTSGSQQSSIEINNEYIYPRNWNQKDDFADKMGLASSGTWSKMASFHVAAGIWLVSVALQYPSNATGIRGIGIYAGTSTSPTDVSGVKYQQTVNAVNGAATNIVLTIPLQVATERDILIMGRQTSGSSMDDIKIRASWLRLMPNS